MRNTIKMLACGLSAAATTLPGLAQAEPTITPLALQAAQDYQLQARFPEWSQAIELGGMDPVLSDRTAHRQSRLGPDGAGPRLTVWASDMTALPGQTVTLHAQLDRVHTPKPSLLGSTRGAIAAERMTGEVIGEHSGSLGTVVYNDAGTGADSVAGDGIYSASFTLDAAKAPALGYAESLMVSTEAVLEGGDLRRAAGGFVYSNPAARLTGKVSDRIADGNLVMAIEMEVLAPGRIHLAGTLADQLGAPFSIAQAAGHFEPGIRTLELRFYGLAFHERAISGPVTLSSLALTSANGMPNAMAPVVSNLHISKPVIATQLTALPFNDAEKLQAATRALASIK